MNNQQMFVLNAEQLAVLFEMLDAQTKLDESLGFISHYDNLSAEELELPGAALFEASNVRNECTEKLNLLQETADDETLKAYMATYIALMQKADEQKT